VRLIQHFPRLYLNHPYCSTILSPLDLLLLHLHWDAVVVGEDAPVAPPSCPPLLTMVLSSALWVTIFVSPSLLMVAAGTLWVTICESGPNAYNFGTDP
jgi:hypothetical protein